MQQLTFVASIAGLLLLTAFAGVSSVFDGAPFETPLDTLQVPVNDHIALRVVD